MFPFVQSVQVFRRHVEIMHSESPLLVLTMQHRSKVDVVMKYHEAKMSDFTGQLLVDRRSNQFLELVLNDVMGTLTGMVVGYNSTQAVQVSTGGQIRKRLQRRIKVTGIICLQKEVTLTLTAVSKSSQKR